MVDEFSKSDKMNTLKTLNVDDNKLLSRSIECNFVQTKLESLRAKMLQEFEKRMTRMIDEVLQDIRQHELRTQEFRHFANGKIPQTSETNANAHSTSSASSASSTSSNHNWQNRLADAQAAAAATSLSTADSGDNVTDSSISEKHLKEPKSELNAATSAAAATTSERKRTLPEKVFITRESYLTALLQVDHMKTIYHIFYIIVIMFLLNTICYDYFTEGRINIGLGTFKSGLYRIHWVLGVWVMEHVFVFTFYYAFRGWAHVRAKLPEKSPLRRFWSHSCLIVYISSQLVFCYVASTLCLRFNLPFVSASVQLLESTRLLMKMHAFMRYNCARLLRGKLKADADISTTTQMATNVPKFSCFLYFLFAPTLIYRDSYPRTAQIRWKFAVNRLLEVVTVAFLYSFIHERHIRAHFENFGRDQINFSTLTVKYFGMMLPSVVIFLCGFYMILHSWLNFTSELLRFGDRMFYKDWWTSATYDAYYRNWNIVVHDWLYEYVYKDAYKYVFRGSKLASSLLVFMISALVHEQVLGIALQLFFPVMFVLFGFVGVSLLFLTRKVPKSLGNLVLWFTIIIGNCCMISLYAMEYYARQNCPTTGYGPWLDHLVPAIWSCYHKT